MISWSSALYACFYGVAIFEIPGSILDRVNVENLLSSLLSFYIISGLGVYGGSLILISVTQVP